MQNLSKILAVVDPTVQDQPAMHRAAWLASATGAEHIWKNSQNPCARMVFASQRLQSGTTPCTMASCATR